MNAHNISIAALLQVLLNNDRPLYRSVKVGGGWWDGRDCAYGLQMCRSQFSICHFRRLQSRLQAWRCRKSQLRLLKSPQDRCQLQAECHDLEEQSFGNCTPAAPGNQDKRTATNPQRARQKHYHLVRDVTRKRYKCTDADDRLRTSEKPEYAR
jgi:hypothetical protein